ncbi:MAG: transporter substrate-binding protein [Marmoricola sp.]|nr:transporter substrate-binding protein [Marmoricola sp.]
MRFPDFARQHSGRLLAITVAAALTLAACGSSSESGGGAEPTDSKEFTYWSMYTQEEPMAKILQSALNAFKTETGIKVNVQWAGRDVLNKVTAALNTDKVPDLVEQSDNKLKAALVENGAVADLGDVYKLPVGGNETEAVGDVLSEKYDPLTQVDGKYFMVPTNVQAFMYWYQGNRLPDVVKNPPATWDEFTSLLSDMKQAGENPLAFDGDAADYAADIVTAAMIRTMGAGAVLKAAEDTTGKAWGAPEVREAVESVATLAADDYFIPGYDASKWPAIQQKWAAGKANLIYMGSWLPAETRNEVAPNTSYNSFNFPAVGESSDPSVQVAINGFSVLKKGAHRDAAKKFIAFFLGKSWMTKVSLEAPNLTPRTDVEVLPSLADAAKIITDNPLVAQNDGVAGTYPQYNTSVFQPLNGKLLLGSISVDDYISELQKQSAKFWEING